MIMSTDTAYRILSEHKSAKTHKNSMVPQVIIADVIIYYR